MLSEDLRVARTHTVRWFGLIERELGVHQINSVIEQTILLSMLGH